MAAEAVNALTQRVLLLETLSQQQSNQIGQLTEQMTIQMKSHQAVHEEVAKIPGNLFSAKNQQIDKLPYPKLIRGKRNCGECFQPS